MNKITGLSIAAIVASGLALPLVGLAASPSHIDDDSVKVSYSDLNITNEAGAKLLYARLQRASQEVCGVGSHNIVRSLTETKKARACYEKALSAAVEKLDSELLTVIHNS
jgi:UrcA family protein